MAESTSADSTTESAERPASFESLVLGWWHSLEEARGDRATLRRCGTTADVAFTPAFHRLLAPIRDARNGIPLDWLAVVASALSHVEVNDTGKSFPQALAAETRGKARLSGLRFRRLLRVESPNEMLTSIVRVLRLLDRTAPVGSLARDLTRWNDRTRKRWALEYYEAAPNEP